MQAWAGFAGAGAVAFAAVKGSNAFSVWRRQKIEERRIEAAERILALAYRLSRAISSIRHPMMWVGPLNEAEKRLREKGTELDHMPDERRRRIIHAQAVFDRINSFKNEWDEVAEATPVAKALFNDDVEQALSKIWRQSHVVAAAAEGYVDDDGTDDDFSKRIRGDLWEALGSVGKDSDEISKTISECVQMIEIELVPVIRADDIKRV